MMNKTAFLAASVLAATTFTSSIALAESPLTANISVTNNYLFRGLTQTADQAAVQGGIDYEHSSGFYAGTWLSNVSARGDSGGGAGFYGTNGNYEQDLYVGYAFDAGPLALDVGYIKYMYPVDSSNKYDYDEVYVNAGWMMLSANISYTVDKEAGGSNQNDLYYSLGTEFDVKDGLMLGLLVGRYDFDGGSANDYTHYLVSLSKNDFTFAYEKNNAKPTDPNWWTGVDDNRFTVSWGKSFDL